MFYLKFLLSLFSRFKVSGSLFFLLGLGLFVLLNGRQDINFALAKTLDKNKVRPHFYSLIATEINVQGIRRKLMALPGIQIVSLIGSDQLQSKVESLLGEMGTGLNLGPIELEYNGLKIVFSDKIKEENRKLLKSYLSRLVGGDNVIIGPTLGAKQNLTTNETSEKLLLRGGDLLIGLFSILFLFVSLSFFKSSYQYSQLTEKYQRKKYIFEKVMSINVIFLVACAIGTCVLIGTPINQIILMVSITPIILLIGMALYKKNLN